MVIGAVEMLNSYGVGIVFLFYEDAPVIRFTKCICSSEVALVHLSNFYTFLLNCMF